MRSDYLRTSLFLVMHFCISLAIWGYFEASIRSAVWHQQPAPPVTISRVLANIDFVMYVGAALINSLILFLLTKWLRASVPGVFSLGLLAAGTVFLSLPIYFLAGNVAKEVIYLSPFIAFLCCWALYKVLLSTLKLGRA